MNELSLKKIVWAFLYVMVMQKMVICFITSNNILFFKKGQLLRCRSFTTINNTVQFDCKKEQKPANHHHDGTAPHFYLLLLVGGGRWYGGVSSVLYGPFLFFLVFLLLTCAGLFWSSCLFDIPPKNIKSFRRKSSSAWVS